MAQDRPVELPQQQQSTITGDMTTADAEPPLAFITTVTADPSTPLLIKGLLAGARARIKSKVAAGEIKWFCTAQGAEEGKTIAAYTYADRWDAVAGKFRFTRKGHDTILVNKLYKGESSAYLASVLIHELVHCYQDEPNPDDPKKKARMEVEAYCIEAAFCEWAWEAQAALTMPEQRAVLDAMVSARKQKALEEAKTC